MSGARNLKLEVILQAVDRMTRPFRTAMGSGNELARAVKAARDQLRDLGRTQANVDSFRKLSKDAAVTQNQLRAAQTRVQQLAKEMEAAENPSAAMARNFNAAVREAQALKRRGAELQQNLQAVRARLDAAGISTANLGQAQRELRGRIASATQALTEQEERLRTATARQRQLAAAQAQYQKGMQTRNAMLNAGASTMAAGGVSLTPIAKAVKDYVSFEDAMLGVARQVPGARDEAGNLTAVYYDMAREVRQLGKELPIPTTAIAEMVTAGARMEVPREELIAYTRTVAMMATAFDAVPEEIAESMGKVAKNFRIPTAGIQSLADTINYLDDNAISKGGDIIDVLNRISGVVSTVKMSSSDAAALASTLLTLGERPEAAATAVNAIVQKFAAAEKGTKKFQAAMQEIGLASTAVQKGMATDATGTLFQVIEAVRKLPKDKRIGVMVELVGMEHSDTLAKLVDKPDEFRRQLELASGDGARGSMQREFDARQATISARWRRLQNQLFNGSSAAGGALRATIVDLMDGIGALVDRFNRFAEANPVLVSWLMKAAAAVGILLTAMGGLTLAIAAAVGPMVVARYGLQMLGLRMTWLSSTLPAAAKHLRTVAGAVASLGATGGLIPNQAGSAALLQRAGALLMQVGRILLFVGRLAVANPLGIALTAAALLVMRYWQPIKAFFAGLWSGLAAGLAPLAGVFGQVFAAAGAALAPLRPVFDWLAGAIKGIWQWLTGLVGPVDASRASLDAAASSGRAFGQWLASIIVVAGELVAKFAMLPVRFVTIGAQIMQGLVTGITQGVGAVKNAVVGIADGVSGWFKAKLGIHSPSRVFAELGGFTMAGLEQGLMQGQGGPVQAIARVADAVTRRAAAGMAGNGMLPAISRATSALAGIGAGAAIGIAPAAVSVPVDARTPISASAAGGRPAAAVAPATYIINVHPPAGADASEIARLVRQEIQQIEAQRQARERSRLTDRD